MCYLPAGLLFRLDLGKLARVPKIVNIVFSCVSLACVETLFYQHHIIGVFLGSLYHSLLLLAGET